MNKLFTLLAAIVLMAVSTVSFAQLSGTKNIPGDYATLLAAITDLNTQGVGAGGVTLNLVAGNPQTAPAGGYSITTTTGTAGNPIIIQGNSNTITAPTPQAAGNLNDAIFKLVGADYVTITGFTMTENASNTTTTAGTNNMTEWGVALLYASTTNGCQNITISNNTIDLNRTYQNTFGIYANSTHSATAVTTSATATGTTGGNHNLTITTNNITDVNIGIVVIGPTASADLNDNLIIGGSLLSANSITNYGTTGTFSSYANVSGTVNGILVRNTKNINISYNTVTSSNGGTTAGTLRGIYFVSASNAPTGTLTQTINNNTISIRSAVATGAMLGIVVESGTGTNTSSLSINNNDFNTITHTVTASGTITLISNSSSVLNTNINSNTFTNISCNTTGSFTFITNSVTRPASAICNANSNSIVTAFSKTGAGGTIQFYLSNGTTPATGTETNTNNTFSNITITGATTIAGWQSTDGSTSSPFGPSRTITGNTFTNITGGSSAITLLNVAYSNSGSTTNNVSGNTVGNVTSSGAITGIVSATASQNFFSNTVNTLSTTGASAILGISLSGGTLQNIYKNKVYDLQSNNASGTVSGISISGGTTINIYNNLVGDLRTPSSNAANPLIGLNITGGTTVNAYYNTIYLNGTSTGALFGSSAVSASTTPTVTLKDNIFANLSTPNGASGYTVAYRRSTTTLTTYGSTSDYNLFYAGTPSSNRLIFSDGTNLLQTLGNYKALTGLSPRDANSVTENPPFLSTSGSSANFLHIDPSVPTYIESGGNPVSGITDDYDGNTRNASTPDIGADEGIFTPPATMSYVSSTTTQNNTGGVGIGNTNAEIIAVQVVTTGSTSPLSLTSIDLNTNGSSDPGTDIVNAKVWYTGTSSTFATTTQYGSTFSGPNGSFTVSGSQTLAEGTNYFWVTYDISGSANVNDFLDAECEKITGSGTMGIQVPSVTAPSGNRQIVGPMSGLYTIGVASFNKLTGKNLELVRLVYRVKKLVAVEKTEANRQPEMKDSKKVIAPNATETAFKIPDDRLQYSEIEVDEEYYELRENGAKYTGSLYAKNTGDNSMGTGNYATITAALSDLNSRGVNGAVEFQLLDATYGSETFPLQFNSNIIGISSSNTVNLRPAAGVTSTIAGSVNSGAVIKVLSSYVTIDGSNSGGTDRSLTIQNNSTTAPNVVLFGSTGTTPITNVTLKNCTITNGANTSSAVVVSDGTTIGSAGYFNTVTIQNNLIQKAFIGVYSIGGTSPQNGNNLSYINNSLTSSGTNSIRLVGLYCQGVNTATITGNTVSNIANSTETASNIAGIWTATGTINATITNNTISTLSNTADGSSYFMAGIIITPAVTTANINASLNTISGLTSTSTSSATASGIVVSGASDGITVERNSISNIKQQSTTGWGCNGIYLGATNTSGNNTVQNNMIYDVAAYGFAGTAFTDNGYGIVIASGTGTRVYNNSVHMTTSQTLTTGQPAALNVISGVTVAGTLDIRNNIFANSQTVGTNRYAMVATASNTVYGNINYNCYYTSGPNIALMNATNRATLSDLRTATGKDVLSFNRLPVFTSTTNLHIQSADLSVNGRGTYISGVTNDYDGDSRPTTMSTSLSPVDVGADQYTPSGFSGNSTVLSGNIFMDGNLRAVEQSGTVTITGVTHFPGVQTPNNGLLRPGNNNTKENAPSKKLNNYDTRKPGKEDKKSSDGTSGGQTDVSAVTTPWVYWNLGSYNNTSGLDIVMNFYYNDEQLANIAETDLKIAYWDGTTWDNTFTQTVNTTNNYIQVTIPAFITSASNMLFAMEENGFPLPVVLSEFNISVNSRDANLKWVTSTEVNNKGFAIERRSKLAGETATYSQWNEVAFINGSGTTNEPKTYTYSDKKLNSGTYQYRLRQVDFNSNFEYFSPSQSDIAIGNPGKFDIGQNYPNPSNPKSKIDYQIPFNGLVSIKVYDIIGREVAVIVNEQKEVGYYSAEFDGSAMASGVYFYRIVAEGNGEKFTKTLKMILVK